MKTQCSTNQSCHKKAKRKPQRNERSQKFLNTSQLALMEVIVLVVGKMEMEAK